MKSMFERLAVLIASSINNTLTSPLMGPCGFLDSYLVYASATLVASGSIALALAVFLRVRLNKLVGLSKNSEASVFDKTFVVFDPYEKITIFHRLLSLLPFVPLIIGFGAGLLFLMIIESGLLLTSLVLIMALGLIVVEELPEVYAESKTLIKAIQGGSSLGIGDIRLLQVTKKIMPRLSSYYVGLSAFLFAFAAVLPIVWSSALWYFALSIGLFLQTSKAAGPASWMIVLVLLGLAIAAFIFLATMAKSRIFGHKTDLGAD
jgi:hypothetical protein